MSCEHCGFSCTKEGLDMSIKTFKNGLTVMEPEFIVIGGGEPTLHPKFKEILLMSIAYSDVWMATNGSNKEISIMLANLAKKGVLGVDLSLDIYHDPISEEVEKAFIRNLKDEEDKRGIRDVTNKEIFSGRAYWGLDGCICEDIVLHPNGDITQCGCKDSPILGNVNRDDYIEIDYYECYKTMEEECNCEILKE